MDNRAEEIVNLVEKKSEDTKALQKVSTEYANEVSKVKNDTTVTDRQRQDLHTHLEEYHKKFNEVVRENPEAGKDIKDAIEASGQDRSSERD